MIFFKTHNVTLPVESITALRQVSNTLYIYTYANAEPIQSVIIDADWNLEAYTRQWQELLAEQEAEREHVFSQRRTNPLYQEFESGAVDPDAGPTAKPKTTRKRASQK